MVQIIYIKPPWLKKKRKKKKPKKKKTGRALKQAQKIKAIKSGRQSKRYLLWRCRVLKRDKYSCQDCGAKGKPVQLHAHHIESWHDEPSKRFVLKNGLTLCVVCHVNIHPWMRQQKKYKDTSYKRKIKTDAKYNFIGNNVTKVLLRKKPIWTRLAQN